MANFSVLLSKLIKGQQQDVKKYQTLIILVILFLVLTVSMLIASAYMTRKTALEAQMVDVAARQGRLLQQMAKNMLDVELFLTKYMAKQPLNTNAIPRSVLSPEILEKIKETQQLQKDFNDVVNAFDKSGTIMLAGNTKVEVRELESDASKEVIQKVYSTWNPYLSMFNRMNNDIQRGQFSLNTLNQIVTYGRIHTQPLMMDTIQMNIQLKAEIAAQARVWNSVQLIGILLSFILFFWIIFGALRQLLVADHQLDDARQQTTDILNTVNEGLFLIDKNLVISDEYSRSLESIINKKDLKGKPLLELLKGSVTDQDINAAKLFIEQLYNPWVLEELIQDLNPLRKVKISYMSEEGGLETKYVDFNFLRVVHTDTEEIEKVFVSVLDITESVHLQESLDKSRLQHNRELETIASILTVNQQHLHTFIETTEQRIHKMNEILKISSAQNLDLQEKARLLFRETHSLKGDASALKLHAFVGAAERQEQQLQELLKKTTLNGNDFLPFTVSLNELLDLNSFVRDLLERLREVSQHMISPPEQPSLQDTSWENYFNQYAHDIAQREGKEVKLIFSGFDSSIVNHSNFNDYKDITIQLLKNAIVHGIELPSERVMQGKSAVGKIELSLLLTKQGSHCLTIKDDGKGIALERIRLKAVELGHISCEQASSLSQQELLSFIFKAGFSTAEKQTEDAGKGIGMDIVQQLTRKTRAKINIDSKLHEFTQMVINFPTENR